MYICRICGTGAPGAVQAGAQGGEGHVRGPGGERERERREEGWMRKETEARRGRQRRERGELEKEEGVFYGNEA